MSFKLIHQHCFISGNLFKETFWSVSGIILQIFFHENFMNHKMSLHVFLDIYKLCFLFLVSPTYSFCIDMTTSLVQRGGSMGQLWLAVMDWRFRTWIFILIPVMGSFYKNTCVNAKVWMSFSPSDKENYFSILLPYIV